MMIARKRKSRIVEIVSCIVYLRITGTEHIGCRNCPFPNKDTKKRVGKVFFSDFRASWSIAMGRKGSKGINNDLFKFVQNGNRVEVIGSAFDNPELLDAWKEAGEQGDQDLLMPAT